MTVIKDWRGTPIEAGARVLYAVRGGSMQEVVEAQIEGDVAGGPPSVTASGRLRAYVIRRQSNWLAQRPRISVSPENVTVLFRPAPALVWSCDA